MFHKAKDIIGCAVHATDGIIGQVTDLFVDSEDWHVRYLAITKDNSTIDNPTDERILLLPMHWVDRLDIDGRAFYLSASHEEVQTGSHAEESTDSLSAVDEALWETFPASDPATPY